MRVLTKLMLALVPAFFFGCERQSLQSTHAAVCGQNPEISVHIGPSLIPLGDAKGATDITVCNQFFAASFAVESASPWGVARGGILDIGIIRDGKPGNDFVSLVDFMPNYWSAWPTTYQTVELLKKSKSEVVIRTSRDWGEVLLETDFTFVANSKLVRIVTRAHNPGKSAIENLQTGYIAWPNGGHLFGMPGITEGDSRPISVTPAFAQWSASYDKDWAMGLHAPFSSLVAYTGRDRYLKHTLAAGETREFEVWLQVEANANLAAFTEAEIKRLDSPAGQIGGSVLDSRNLPMESGAVVVKQEGRVHSWTLLNDSRYSLTLKPGEYELFATGPNFAPGTSRFVSVGEGDDLELNLDNVQAPGSIEFRVVNKATRAPLDAMISVAVGSKPIIKHYGKSRFFTELNDPGRTRFSAPPGNYQFDVSVAGGFLSKVELVEATVLSGQTTNMIAGISMLAPPADRNWYSADLHHHSDVLDGFTNPEYVLRSQLAAGIDISFLSDHDSVKNNAEMNTLSAERGMSFIGGTELSASWGHFNAYPLDPDLKPAPDVGLMSVQEIFKDARRLGAQIIHVNHPYGNYGYFDSLQQETDSGSGSNTIVPGGYDPGFDLIEITTEHDERTLQRAWQLWNSGKPAYFSAGSDVHDVWNTLPEHSSGAARSYVYLTEPLAVETYIEALKAGHSYASQGPLIYPELMFGTTLEHQPGTTLSLRYELQSVVGLKSARLIERGQEIDVAIFDTDSIDAIDRKMIEFKVEPAQSTWYSLVVADLAGNYAYSNPLWIYLDPEKYNGAEE